MVIENLYAVPGQAKSRFEAVLGPHGSRIPNDNTERLISFCASHGLAVTGSWFKRLDIHRETWISNDGKMRKEVDHILIKNRSMVRSHKVYIEAEAPANTDHRLLIASVALQKCLRQK